MQWDNHCCTVKLSSELLFSRYDIYLVRCVSEATGETKTSTLSAGYDFVTIIATPTTCFLSHISSVKFICSSYLIMQTSCSLSCGFRLSLRNDRASIALHVWAHVKRINGEIAGNFQFLLSSTLSRVSRWYFPCKQFHFLHVSKDFFMTALTGNGNNIEEKEWKQSARSFGCFMACLSSFDVLIMGACRLMSVIMS